MDFSLPTAVVGALLGSAILTAVMIYFYRLPGKPPGVGWWVLAFLLATARYLVLLPSQFPLAAQNFLAESLQAISAIFLLAGVLSFIGRRVGADAVALASLAVALWAGYSTFVYDHFLLRTVPLYLLGGGAMIVVAATFFRMRAKAARSSYVFIGTLFLLWGLHKFNYPFMRPVEWFAPIGFLMTQALSMAIAMSLIILSQRRQQELAERANSRAAFLASFDDLTGLPNRNAFALDLARAINRAADDEPGQRRRLVLFNIDLDRFKEVNEVLGHQSGDELLGMVAGRLTAMAEPGHMIARLSGDNFALCMPIEDNPDGVEGTAARIIDALTRPFAVGERDIRIGCSVGIALYPDDADSAPELLRHADTAEDQAKRSGGNAYVFYSDKHSADVRERLSLRQDLHAAVERSEFLLHYQPMVATNSGELVGAEALIRWNHPERGLMMPGAFIQAAEESTLIVPIGLWALRAAAARNRMWQEAGLAPVRVSVNLSAVQFRLSSLVADIEEILRQTELSPELLGIEVTESVLVEDPNTAHETLTRLRGMGIEIAIDDFGTGYSSLSQLRNFPIDKLKIDMSFVRDIPGAANDEAVVRGIIRLGHSMNMQVVAEGVETAEQEAFLRLAGCDILQGYLYGRPGPPKDIERMLTPLPGSRRAAIVS